MKNTLTSSIQDKDGTWWYLQPSGIRQRAKVKKCPTCDEQFLTYPTKSSDYCSVGCYRKVCTSCSGVFAPRAVRQRYCSNACKSGTAVCTQCNATFVLSKNSDGKFCSTTCHYESKCPIGTVRDAGGGYKIIKVPKGTIGTKKYGPVVNHWMLEHRWVMQQMLGRPLGAKENVHHINGKRDDNRPENLELWKRSQPAGIRSKDYHCSGCSCFALPKG